MRKILLTTLLVLISINVGMCGGFSLKIKMAREQATPWSGLSIGYNALNSSASYLSQAPASLSVNLNLIDTKIVNWNDLSIFTGLGFEFNNFRFSGNNSLTTDADGVVVADYSYDDAGIKLSKSKLSTNYVNVPLMFNWFITKDSYIYAGVIGGWMYNAHTKVKGDFGKVKARDLPLNNLRYGYGVGFGTGVLGIYARYYPDSIFKNGYGADIPQFNIGIHFNFSAGSAS